MSKLIDSEQNISISQNESQKPFCTNESNPFKLLNSEIIKLKPISEENNQQKKINFSQVANNSFKALNFLRQNSTKKFEEDNQIKKVVTGNKKSLSNEDEDYIDDQKNLEMEIQKTEALNRRLYRREKICDTDTEDEESDFEKDIPWIIFPDNIYKTIWDLYIVILNLYTSIIIPYIVAFTEENEFSKFELIISISFAIDIILSFFTAYTDSEENLVKQKRKIIMTYLNGWFIIDLISVIPFQLFFKKKEKVTVTGIHKSDRLFKLIKTIRILTMSKGSTSRVTKFLLEKLKLNATIEKLIVFLLLFFLLNHLCACLWVLMAKLQDMNPDSWIVRLGYVDISNMELYTISFYWTLTTVTTVGYGDISAGTTSERVFNLFIMSFGVLLYSFAIGSLSSIVSTMDQQNEEMDQKLQILSSIKKEFNLDQGIYDKVRKVIKYDLSRNQKDKMIFLQELPNKLRIELSQIMQDKAIQNLYFFRDQPSDFFAYVAPLLKPVKFSQNDYLYKVQDMIDEMYFIAKGTVIFCLDKKYGEKEVKEFKKNNNFGEIEMCLNEKLSVNIKIKSRNCELFVLKKNDFLRLSVNFKEFIESFLHSSLMKYLKFNEEKNRMIKEFETLIRPSDESSSNGGSESNEIEEEENSENSDLINSDEESEKENNINENNNNNNNEENKNSQSDLTSHYEDEKKENKRDNMSQYTIQLNKCKSKSEENKSVNYDSKRDNNSLYIDSKRDNNSLHINSKRDNDSLHFDSKRDNKSFHFDSKRDNNSLYNDSKRDNDSLHFDSKRDNNSLYNDSKRDNNSLYINSKRDDNSLHINSKRDDKSLGNDNKRDIESINKESKRDKSLYFSNKRDPKDKPIKDISDIKSDGEKSKKDSVQFERYNSNVIFQKSLQDENSAISSIRLNNSLLKNVEVSRNSTLKFGSQRTYSENSLFSLKECQKEDKKNDNKSLASKLEKKIDKIIDSINDRELVSPKHKKKKKNEDPRDLLNKLKNENDPNRKNEIIDQIENIFQKIYGK